MRLIGDRHPDGVERVDAGRGEDVHDVAAAGTGARATRGLIAVVCPTQGTGRGPVLPAELTPVEERPVGLSEALPRGGS